MKRILYPDVDINQIIQIYNKSQDNPIWGYDYFVDLLGELKKAYPISPNDPLPHDSEGMRLFLPRLQRKVLATGVQLCWTPTPREELERGVTFEEWWLIVFTTGFNQTAHVDADEDMIKRIKVVLDREDEPRWWIMKEFSYPPPQG